MKTKNLLKEIERMGRHCFNQPIIGARRRPIAQQADIDYGGWVVAGRRRNSLTTR